MPGADFHVGDVAGEQQIGIEKQTSKIFGLIHEIE